MDDPLFPSLDILTGLRAVAALSFLGSVACFLSGIRLLQTARKVRFFRMRRQQLVRGWRLLAACLVLAGVGAAVGLGGERAAHALFTFTATPPASPTAGDAPTITLTPTITETPTITATASGSETPSASPTPHIPLAVEAQFSAELTPNPAAVFSPLTFARGINSAYQPEGASLAFSNPIQRLYALFSYDQMLDGSQWTALWFRDGTLVHFETQPWNGGTGGLGYSDWNPEPSEWLAGTYQVQIFVGHEFKTAGEFTVVGDPPTRTATPTASTTVTPTSTITSTQTITPTLTNTPGATVTPNITPTPIPPTATP